MTVEATLDREVPFTLNGHSYVLKYRDSDHSYRVQCDGGAWERYVANSTISKVSYSDPGGLMGYARNEALEGRHHKDSAQFAQECGSAAHAHLEAFIAGEPLDPLGEPERVRGALTALRKWLDTHTPEFVGSELVVCSPSMRVAGRFDFLARVDGELVLADLKTAEKDWDHFRRYKAAAAFAQLAGYALAYAEMFPDAEQPTARAVLHVNTAGAYDFKRDMAPELSERAFLAKLKTYRSDQEWDKADKSLRKVAA